MPDEATATTDRSTATHDHPHATEPEYVLPTPLTPEDAERMEKARKVLTAFLVVVEPDGRAWATNDVNMDMVLERSPTPGDMYRSCAEVMKDIQSSQAATQTVQMLASVWPQIAAQQQELERQNRIAQKLIDKGIHVPGR